MSTHSKQSKEDAVEKIATAVPSQALSISSTLHLDIEKLGSEATFSASPTEYQSDASSSLSSARRAAEDSTRRWLRWRLASAFFAYFLCGWGDGVTGTLLPVIMKDVHLDFMTSSLLFLASTAGFFAGTLPLESILNQLGLFDLNSTHYSWVPAIDLCSSLSLQKARRRVIGHSPSQSTLLALLISSTLHGMFFVMMGSGGGFGVMFSAYAVAAFARSILTGPLNKFYVSVDNSSASYAFGFWTLGGMVSTLICQSLLALNVHWTIFFLSSLVLSAINVVCLVITFRPTHSEFAQDLDEAKNKLTTGNAVNENKIKALRTALSSGLLWAICIFTALYYGWWFFIVTYITKHTNFILDISETPMQGFIVSYLLDTRNANPKTAGYVSSGFWAGITIGQFLWGVVSPKLTLTQRKIAVLLCMYIYLICRYYFLDLTSFRTAVGLIMQILIWAIPSDLGNSISASIIGLVYGPVFPASFSLAKEHLPDDIQRISLALISAASNVGSALFSFLVGVISSTEGVHTLPYITIPLAITSICIWAFIPAKKATA